MRQFRLPRMLLATSVALAVAGSALAQRPSKRSPSSGGAVAGAAAEGVVNINTATVEQLVLLPGIGPAKAEAIVRARQRRPFATVSQIQRVRGIGRATLRRLLPYLAVRGETTLTRPVRRGTSEARSSSRR